MIETYATSADLAQAAAQAVTAALKSALAERGAASLVGTGGRSPAPVYDLLAQARDVDWARVGVTLSDDRFVPISSPDSNERLVRERLLTDAAAKAVFTPISTAEENVEPAA